MHVTFLVAGFILGVAVSLAVGWAYGLTQEKEQRPTYQERKILAYCLLESGSTVNGSTLREVYGWASIKANWPVLDMVLDGTLGINVYGCTIKVVARKDKPPWLRMDGQVVEV